MTENVKLDIYNAIETALNEITELKNVLKYNSQDVNNEAIIQKQYPQAWISFSNIEWQPSETTAYNKNETQQQKGNVNITVHIEQYTLKGNEASWKTHLTLINTVYRKLANMGGENYSPLQRITELDDTDNNNVRDWQIVFSSHVTENGVTKSLEDATPVTLTLINVVNP